MPFDGKVTVTVAALAAEVTGDPVVEEPVLRDPVEAEMTDTLGASGRELPVARMVAT